MEGKIFEERRKNSMDELYTVEEMLGILKVSRGTLYTMMDEGLIPFVKIRGHRRFIARQVMTAIKEIQKVQQINSLRGVTADNAGEKEVAQLVPNDTL